MSAPTPFKLTYSTMFDPPAELHARFEAALAAIRPHIGAEHAMLIGEGNERALRRFEARSPIDTRFVLGRFQAGGATEADAAVAAAQRAFPGWARTPWRERVALLRRTVALIEERVYYLGAVLALEVGKNRMEALGEAQETADLIAYYCDQMEANDGYVRPMASDPVAGYASENASVLKPHGVWLVIAPFNFPFALSGGPSGAALVAGNTVVFKAASATAVERPAPGGCVSRCGSAVRGLQLRDGSRDLARRSADPSPGCRRRHLHRLLRRRHASPSDVRRRALAAAMHRRDGRQERGDRQPARQHRRRGARRHAFGIRPFRAEMLGLLARLRRAHGIQRFRRRACTAPRCGLRSATRPSARTGWDPSSTPPH